MLWKKAKLNITDDMFQKLGDYWPIGPKEDSYKEYEKFDFIRKNLEGISEEAVDEYSAALGKLYRWMLLAIETRIENVKIRYQLKTKAKEEQKAAQDAEAERVAKRTEAMEAAKAAFNEKVEADKAAREGGSDGEDDIVPEFDEEEFNMKFDEDNLPVDIPEVDPDDIDNDFNIEIPQDVEAAE